MLNWEEIYAAGQQLNRYPYAEVVSFFKRVGRHTNLDGKVALDIGCGSGVHAQFLAEADAHVFAFDPSASAIKHARKLHPHSSITYQVAGLSDVGLPQNGVDLAVDRLASTYATIDTVTEFYQRLRLVLRPGARLLWQGFDLENTGRSLGEFDASRDIWTGFSSGVFRSDDTISFFAEDDLLRVFEGYDMLSKRVFSDVDLESGYRHSYWNLELGYGPTS